MEKKHVIFIMVLLLLIVGCVITFKVVVDLNRENDIKNEIKEISKVFTLDTENYDEINEILNRRIIKKGEYAQVEDAIKKYYIDLTGDLKNLAFLLDSDSFTKYLTGKNILEDGPLFLKSRSNLSNSKTQIVNYYEKFTKNLSSDYNIIYLPKLKKYYVDFYLELTSLALPTDFNEILKVEYDNVLANIDIYNQAFDFLYANRNEWEVRNNELYFNDATILDEYNSVLSEFNKTKKELEIKDE